MGKLIVIEGIDGSGKETQSKLLKKRLNEEGLPWYETTFPQYDQESSYFVRQYLSGAYGTNAQSVSAKQASYCYAMDRFHTFRTNKELQQALSDSATTVIADRYTTSNILFQAAKFDTPEEMFELIDWICNLEYGDLGLPVPDAVIMPHVEIEKNIELLKKRDIEANAGKNHMTTDIHERDFGFIRRVSAASEIIAERMGFKVIDCMDEENNLRKEEDIHEEIYGEVKKLILKPNSGNTRNA